MKILMTTDTVGGVWNYALQLTRALLPRGVDVHLATMGAPLSRPQRDDARCIANLTVHESSFRLEWMRDPWEDVRAAGRWLLELEAEVGPDVVHLNGFAHGALPWRAPVLVVGHSCVLSWWRAVHGTDAPAAEWQQYRDAATAGLRAAALVAAPTQAMLDALHEHYGPLPRTRVIPNGRDVDAPPLGARDAFGRYPRYDALHTPAVLAAGRAWDESKGTATLVEAAPEIRWPVHVAGAETDPEGVRRLLPNVNALGTLTPEALQYWYRRAPIFVQPSLYEPFGLAPLEAALHRCALVLSDIPSLREVWGDAAVFVPARDPAALAEAVNRLIGDAALLMRHADAAYQRARTFTARRMASTYHECYARLLQRPSRKEALACAS